MNARTNDLGSNGFLGQRNWHNYHDAPVQSDLTDLNQAGIPSDDAFSSLTIWRGHSMRYEGSIVETYFENLEDVLAAQISCWPVIFGCMAWLTNAKVLNALASRRNVSIIVQKEDFLRPDSDNWSSRRLKEQYNRIPATNMEDAGLLYNRQTDEKTIEGVRCVGIRQIRGKTSPRMHHKFMVFCTYETYPHRSNDGFYSPQAVWTGSFNATANGSRSLENAILIRDQRVANCFRNEWAAILGLSEPLDWNSEYIAPQYNVGS
jgi:hypothetical protein